MRGTLLQTAPLGGQCRSRVGLAGRDSLHHRRFRLLCETVFEREHPQVCADGIQQLSRAQQIVGITRPAELGIACCERLVDQQPAGRKRIYQRGEERAVQIVGDDDYVELRVTQWPGTGLQIGRDELDIRIAGKRLRGRRIAIQRGHFATACSQQPCMTAAAGCDVERTAAGADTM